jgi:hypothetical protein
MAKTVTSLFHSEQQAAEAARRLEQAGIPKDAIDIWTTPHNLAPLLEDLGVSRADAYAYVEGVLGDGTVIIVKCDDAAVGGVVGILDQEGVLDLDDERASWRTEERQEDDAAGLAGPAAGAAPPAEAGQGRVRIHSRARERPAQE